MAPDTDISTDPPPAGAGRHGLGRRAGDAGATLVEYGLLVGVIAVACLVAVTVLERRSPEPAPPTAPTTVTTPAPPLVPRPDGDR